MHGQVGMMNHGATNSTMRPPGPGLVELARLATGDPSNLAYTLLPEVSRRYGDVVNLPVPVPGLTMTLISHPDHLEQILIRKHENYRKHESARELAFDEPTPFGLLEGEEWKRMRRLLSPHFRASGLANAGPGMLGAITDRVEAWTTHVESRRPAALHEELGLVVLDGLLRSMFSSSWPSDRLTRCVTATRDYDRYMLVRVSMDALPYLVPRPFRKRGKAAKRFLYAQADQMIAQRRSDGPGERTDLLDALLKAPFPGSGAHQYARLRSELVSLMLGAASTTTSAVGWAVALLFADTDALARARAEVDALGGEPADYRHLADLPYLQCCFDESQRIQSWVPINRRIAIQEDEIGGYAIPAGSHLLYSPYGIHRDSRFWKNPEEFRPSRFQDDEINQSAFLPFSIGPRKCMGYRMANAAAVLTLASILQRYALTLPPNWRPQHHFSRAMQAPVGSSMTLKRRVA
ncbi:MAG: cytochrome P450 [Mycobacterium sp.]|nr:cytochrome P450 [Mycobacterium sp.]